MKKIIFIACLLAMLVHISCKHKQVEVKLAPNEYYTCSMDVQVMEKHPGPCPICGMPMIKASFDQDDKNKLHISKAQMKLANIRVDTTRMKEISEEIHVAARVTLNETQTIIISSKVTGRIEWLHVRNPGEMIHKGEVLYEIYSEQLAAAERDYLVALNQVKSGLNGDVNYNQIAEAAANKLLLWGLNQKQINDLTDKPSAPDLIPIYAKESGVISEINIKEGEYAQEGESIYKLNKLSSVWVQGQLYADEGRNIKEGEAVKVRFYDYPSKIFSGKISFISPELSSNSKVNQVRIELINPDFLFKPGMSATVIIQSKSKIAIALPLEAVLQDSKGASVWMQDDNGNFESRMVRTGLRNSNVIEIVDSLRVGEMVVISGAYLIQSEYQFKKGSNPMKGMKM